MRECDCPVGYCFLNIKSDVGLCSFWNAADTAHVRITCPRCGFTSYHPGDIEEGYCGKCHDWTSDARRPR